MTGEHDALRDVIAAVALGAAPPDEVARVEAHAAECLVCREELAQLRVAADGLATAVPQHEPRQELKDALMATVRAEARVASPGTAVASAPSPARRRRIWFTLPRMRVALAVMGVALVGLLAWNVTLLRDTPATANVVVSPITGTDALPAARGQVVFLRGRDTAVVQFEGLPALPSDRAYQLWALRPGVAPRSVGLLEDDGARRQAVAIGDLAGIETFAITAQPRTNRAAPEGPILAQGAFRTT